MTCTLTAVPYVSTSGNVANRALNPRAVGNGATGWQAANGTGGAVTLATRALTTDYPGPPGVPATNALMMTQGSATAATAILFVLGQLDAWVAGQGRTVVGSVWVRSNEARNLRVTLDWRSTSAQIGYSQGAWFPVAAAGEWVRLLVTANAPAGATGAYLAIESQSTYAAGNRIHVAAPMISDGSAAVWDYFEVGKPAPIGTWPSWVGAADASASLLNVRTPHPTAGLLIRSTPTLVLDYSAPRESASVEHPILARPDPLHALGPLRTRKGSLELFYPTLALARAAERLHESPRVMLQDTEYPELDMYYRPRAVALAPTQERTVTQRWRLSVDYTEVYATAGLY